MLVEVEVEVNQKTRRRSKPDGGRGKGKDLREEADRRKDGSANAELRPCL